MGLFGGKKDGVKITDYFSAEDLQKITDTVGPKLTAGKYPALPQLMAKGLMDYVSRPDKVYSRGKMNSFAKVADAMKEIEPSLAEILQNAVNKIRG